MGEEALRGAQVLDGDLQTDHSSGTPSEVGGPASKAGQEGHPLQEQRELGGVHCCGEETRPPFDGVSSNEVPELQLEDKASSSGRIGAVSTDVHVRGAESQCSYES